MGKLIDRERRLAAKKRRGEHRELVLRVAHQSFMRFPFAEVSLESIDKASNLKTGKTGMLFGSKEELFLELVLKEFADWGRDLMKRLAPETLHREKAVNAVAESLEGRRALLNWVAELHIALAGHVDGGSVHVFMHGLRSTFEGCGERIEAVNPDIETGDGARRLMRCVICAAAMMAISRPSGALAIAVMQSDAQWTEFDFETELRRLAQEAMN